MTETKKSPTSHTAAKDLFAPTRRRLLQGSAAAVAMSQFARLGATPTTPIVGNAKEAFLMDRITFGVDPFMHEKYLAFGNLPHATDGYMGFLEWQLDPGGPGHNLDHEAQVQANVRAISYPLGAWSPGGTASVGDIKDHSPWEVTDMFTPNISSRDCTNLSVTDIAYQGVHSRYQLQNVITEFWSNVFNIYSQQDNLWSLYTHTLDTAIRPNALGKFGDLLLAVTRSPAMMVYLNQHQSVKSKPNENFARELLELHTVGVGNHTEQDVEAVARILTGWSIHSDTGPGSTHYDYVVECVGAAGTCSIPAGGSGLLTKENLGSAVYISIEHSLGKKKVLGRTYGSNVAYVPGPPPPAWGLNEGLQLLQDLALDPLTAETLVRRMIKWFFYDVEPPASLLNRVTGVYLSSGGDIADTLLALFDDSYLDDIYMGAGAKVRRPFNMLLGMLRQRRVNMTSLSSGSYPIWIPETVLRGHAPAWWPAPDGHPAENDKWTSSIIPRLAMSDEVAYNLMQGLDLSNATLEQLIGTTPSSQFATLLDTRFSLGQLPTSEFAELQSYIDQVQALADQYNNSNPEPHVTATDIMRESLSAFDSLPSRQYLS